VTANEAGPLGPASRHVACKFRVAVRYRDKHTLEIYHHIPNSQLCIFPNATHMIPYDEPALFNSTVERFFGAPFAKKDRLKDFLKSFQAMKTSQQ
jgi:hypothetical protein